MSSVRDNVETFHAMARQVRRKVRTGNADAGDVASLAYQGHHMIDQLTLRPGADPYTTLQAVRSISREVLETLQQDPES